MSSRRQDYTENPVLEERGGQILFLTRFEIHKMLIRLSEEEPCTSTAVPSPEKKKKKKEAED